MRGLEIAYKVPVLEISGLDFQLVCLKLLKNVSFDRSFYG